MKGLLFTYFLTYGGAAAALFNPFIGLCIYAAFSILKPESLWPWSVPPGPYSKIVAEAMLLGWIGQGFGKFRFGRATLPVVLLMAYWGWCGLSAFQAANSSVAWAYMDQMTKMYLPVIVGMTLVNSIERLRILAWVITLSQGFVAFELNLSYLGGYNVLHEQGFAGMDNNSAAIAFVTALGTAFFLGMHVEKRWQKAVCFAFAAFLAHAILFSFSRGGILAMITASFIGFLMIPKRPSHYIAFGLAAVVALSLAGKEVRERVSTAFAEGEQRDASAQSRIDLWRDCWDVIQKNPVFGVGPDHWPLIAHHYGWPPGKEAHSLWVQNAAEIGIPGILLLIGFFVVTMRRIAPLCREAADVPAPWFRDAARMTVTSLVGFMISAQFVSLEGLEIPYYVALLGCGTLRLATCPDLLPENLAEEWESDEESEHSDTNEGDDFAEEANLDGVLTH